MRPLVHWRAWEHLPRLGWVELPSPLGALPELAASLGFASLLVKRDDQLPALGGGSKPRKLDFLLAIEPFAGARSWRSVGAIGSGHLLSLARASEQLGRAFTAHCFPQPWTRHAASNAARLCATSAEIRSHRSRAAVALSQPGLLVAQSSKQGAVIPPGATNPSGMLGFVRAGLELAEQLQSTGLEPPTWIYVAFGSGGAAAGLSVGLALAGVTTRVRAVAAVETGLANGLRLRQLQRALLCSLRQAGVVTSAPAPVPVHIDHGQLGAGYGDPTPDALGACTTSSRWGLALEPTYTGKVMAALLRRAPEHAGQHVLFWHTARAADPGPLPALPAEARRLLIDVDCYQRRARARRRFLYLGGAAALGLAGWHRFAAYADLPEYAGRVLSSREAAILMAAATLTLPSIARERRTLLRVLQNVDHYVATLPWPLQRRLRLAIVAFEHATALDGELERLTRLTAGDAERYFAALAERGGTLAQVQRAVRDLCLLGYYQLPETFRDLGYEGPWLSDAELSVAAASDPLSAPRDRLPRGMIP